MKKFASDLQYLFRPQSPRDISFAIHQPHWCICLKCIQQMQSNQQLSAFQVSQPIQRFHNENHSQTCSFKSRKIYHLSTSWTKTCSSFPV